MFNGAIIAGASGQGGGFYPFEIDQSLRFEDGDNAYLSRTPASAGNRKTWTFSCWVKRGNIKQANILTAYTSASDTTNITFDYGDGSNLQWYDYISGYRIQLTCSQVFRDVAGWYHLVFALDTTQATASDRAKIWVNGERVTAFLEETYPSQNADLKMNTAIEHRIGDTAQYTREFDGYLADVNFIDGQALEPTSLGQTKSGIWIPKDTVGLTFGTNGFRLEYGDSAAIGDDTSGNTNDWTVNNLVASDVVLDSPTNNFGVMSSIDKGDGTATYSEGNLKVSVGDNEEAFGSFGMSSGKWYWEIRYVSSAASNNKIGLGIADTAAPNNNEVTNNGHQGTTYAPNDILAVAVDVDNELFSFYKNGTIIETNTNWSAKGWYSIKPIVTSSNSSGEEVCVLNFGQDSTFAGAITAGGNTDSSGQGDFKYAPPSGFLALCAFNLPEGGTETINNETPDEYFNVVEYTGNNPNTNSITGVGFQPDFIWIDRISTTQTARTCLYDVIRPFTNRISSSTDNVQTSGILSSFDSDGFTLAADTAANSFENRDGETMVVWNWKAGGSGSSNSDGSITSTVSVGSTSAQKWFSIVKYAGTGSSGTYGHGLDAAPDLILTKNTDQSDDWAVYSSVLGTGKYVNLSDTSAAVTAADIYPSVSSTTIGVEGSDGKNNTSGEDYISYCFVNAEGFCKAGSFVGNGSTDGTFVYLGFRPRYFFLKESDGTGGWKCVDTLRSPINPNTVQVELNSAGGQETDASYHLDILSNGFKLRTNQTEWNGSGDNYIFLAIAEQPFKYANAR